MAWNDRASDLCENPLLERSPDLLGWATLEEQHGWMTPSQSSFTETCSKRTNDAVWKTVDIEMKQPLTTDTKQALIMVVYRNSFIVPYLIMLEDSKRLNFEMCIHKSWSPG